MTDGTRTIAPRSRPFRHALSIAAAVLVWLAAGYLWQVQDRSGPGRHRVHVRFAADVSADARLAFERQRGLTAGEDKGTRTWAYLLADQSPTNIRALLQSPLVEDTAHIDLDRLRVRLDRPDLDPRLRELLEGQWLPYGAWALVTAGLGLVWTARTSAGRWIRAAARDAPGLFRAIAGRFETLTTRHEILLGLALGAYFLMPMLWHGPTDDEELGLGVFSSQIYYRDLLLHGRWSYWFTNLGFGTPMPLGQRLDFHPAFALGSLISLRVALSALWIVQVGVAAVYVLRLLALYGLTPRIRLVLLGLYLFSMPSFLYFFTTDWVSCQVPWTLYPLLVYYLRDAVTGGAATRWWQTTIRLGLLFSVWVLNAHPGYLGPLFIPLAAYTLVAARPTLAAYGSIATAGVLALAASAERIYFLAHEMGFFPANSSRVSQLGFSLLEYLTVQAAPFTELRNGRQPYIGAVLFGAALAAPVLWRSVDRHARGCIVAFFVALLLSIVPLRFLLWTGLSGAWLFRDGMVLFGLLAAAAVAQSVLRTHSRGLRWIVLALVGVQVLQQFVLFAPGYRAHWVGNTRLAWYRHQGRPFGITEAVTRASSRYGTRLYLSAKADSLSRGVFSQVGVHVVTDYALLGLNPVNAWFKNVSMDRISPSRMMMHGYIRGQREVIENPTLLDVLGINLIVAMADEGLAPSGVTHVEALRVSVDVHVNAGVEIFGNPDAWPKAVLLSPAARDADLPLIAACGHTGALCRDYTALAATRLPQDVSLREAGDGYQLRVPPADAPRLLFLSAFYRPEWVATADGQPLTIEPIAGAFIGVTVPPGAEALELRFRPRTRIALTWLSAAALVGMLAALGAISWRRRTASGRR